MSWGPSARITKPNQAPTTGTSSGRLRCNVRCHEETTLTHLQLKVPQRIVVSGKVGIPEASPDVGLKKTAII